MRHETGFWQKIVGMLSGETLAIIGADQTGKTTLFKYMWSQACANGDYKATFENISVPSFTLKDDTGRVLVRVKSATDVGGATSHLDQWAKVVKTAQIVCYLFRADKLMREDAAVDSRMWRDFDELERILSEKRKIETFHLIGNFCDLAPEYNELSEIDRHNEYTKRLIQHQAVKYGGSIVKQFIRDRAQVHYHAGSLKTEDSCERLVESIFGVGK